VGLFIFDMMRFDHSGFLPQAEAHDLYECYEVPTPRFYGCFVSAQWREVRKIVERLNAEEREGVVFKLELEKEVPKLTRLLDQLLRGAALVD
jgi:ATP-dependent RNA circularization protein (DNA/RNA ligase family)